MAKETRGGDAVMMSFRKAALLVLSPGRGKQGSGCQEAPAACGDVGLVPAWKTDVRMLDRFEKVCVR